MSVATQAREDAAAAVRNAAATVTEQIRSGGEEAYQTVRSEAERLAAERRDGVAGFAFDLSDAFESASATLEERGRRGTADFARRAAAEIDAFGGRVQGQDIGGLLHRAEDFARQRPALVLGGALLISLAMIRFFGRHDEPVAVIDAAAPAADAGADAGAFV